MRKITTMTKKQIIDEIYTKMCEQAILAINDNIETSLKHQSKYDILRELYTYLMEVNNGNQ